MRWGGFFRDLFGGASRQVSVHGEMLPSGDMAYAGQQVSPSPIDISEYRLMRRHPTVASSLEVRLTGMLPGLQVVAADEHDPRAMKSKGVVERCLSLMNGSPLVCLKTLADEGLTYGATIAEPVWTLAPGGYWTLRAIKPKRMESMRTALVCDEYGNLEGVRQTAPGAPDFVAADQIIYWRHRGGWYEPYGVSALYEAYDAWKAQTIFVRAWAVYLSRHGQGIMTWKVPKSQVSAEKTQLVEIMENLQTGMGIVLRDGVDNLELIESSGTPGTVYQAYYQTLDKAMVRAILYQELATGEGVRVGSFAASQTQADIMWSVLRVQGEGFCEDIREQIFPRLLARNGYGDLPVPRLIPEPIGAPPNPAELVNTLSTGIMGGVLPPLTPAQAQDVLARLGVSAAIQEGDRDGGSLSTEHRHDTVKLAAPPKRTPEMARLEREMTAAEEAAASDIEAAWRAAVPGIVDRISAGLFDTKANAWKTQAPGVIRDTVTSAIKHRGSELRDAVLKHLENRYQAGAKYGRSKLRRKKLAAPVGTIEFTPTQALDALKQGAFLALQRRYDTLAENLYYAVTRAVRGDVTIREAAAQIQAVVDEDGFSYDNALTLVRTQMAQAYNEGRMGVWDEFKTNDRYTSDVDAIIAYRWNSVLDHVTTDECRQRDGMVFAPDQIDIPPLHYNCRSVIEPIYAGDAEGSVDALPWTNRADMPIPGFERSEEKK